MIFFEEIKGRRGRMEFIGREGKREMISFSDQKKTTSLMIIIIALPTSLLG